MLTVTAFIGHHRSHVVAQLGQTDRDVDMFDRRHQMSPRHISVQYGL